MSARDVIASVLAEAIAPWLHVAGRERRSILAADAILAALAAAGFKVLAQEPAKEMLTPPKEPLP